MMGVKRIREDGNVSVDKKGGQVGFVATRNCKASFYFPRVRKRARMTNQAHDRFEPVTALTFQQVRIFFIERFEVRQLPKSDTVTEAP